MSDFVKIKIFIQEMLPRVVIILIILIVVLVGLSVGMFFVGRSVGDTQDCTDISFTATTTPGRYGPNDRSSLNYVNSLVYFVGFEYDDDESVYITRQNALQRLGGYNALYDDLSTLLGMVIDIEPITFTYDNTDYMIELWKGQYYASVGCEIGIYLASPGNPGRYYCAPDADMLQMSYTLLDKDGKKLFGRSGIHWWLTGFKPGVYSDPVDLTMDDISITFKSTGMATAFFNAVKAHFNDETEYQYKLSGDIVTFKWKKTKFPQPNKADRAAFLGYDKALSEGTATITGGNFTPEYINVIVTQTLTFLETDDTIDTYINWVLDNKDGTKAKELTLAWDAKYGTNIISIYNLLDLLKTNYAIIFTTGLDFLMAIICALDRSFSACVFFPSS